MAVAFAQIDAFTGTPFRGNPAAVCLLQEWQSVAWLQSVAAEMNLSETAFLVRSGDAFDLRWFTPTVEVDLCGHATLAAAHFLWENGLVPLALPARFGSRSGNLTATKEGAWITLDFPRADYQTTDAPEGLDEALGAHVEACFKTGDDLITILPSASEVEAAAPEWEHLKLLPYRAVIVTAAAEELQCDFVSRFFAPALGIPEDPVTGSAHCSLAPFWSERLGKRSLSARQASSRGGELRLQVLPERVLISGRAVTVMRGELLPTR